VSVTLKNVIITCVVRHFNCPESKIRTLHFIEIHPNFHMSYGILLRKYKNVMITLKKEQENPLKIGFCFQTEVLGTYFGWY
jgi:hypothetical protein